jgi:RNA-directed DNA polymerase
VAGGYGIVVDIDLEAFFNRVQHDVLMARLARRIGDKRLLRLVRRFLQAGLMHGGLSSPRHAGMPQGGPLSPLLSNLLLDDLDKELERRGHRFCRYADDCNIYVRTRPAGERSWHRSRPSWKAGCGSRSTARRAPLPRSGNASSSATAWTARAG